MSTVQAPSPASSPAATPASPVAREKQTSWSKMLQNVLVTIAALLVILAVGAYLCNMWFATKPSAQVPAPAAPATPAAPAPATPVPPVPPVVLPAAPQPAQAPAAAVPVISSQTATTANTTNVANAGADNLANYATSTVSKDDDSTHMTIRIHKNDKRALYYGDGKHMPRKVEVYSMVPFQAPCPPQVQVPVQVDAHFVLPTPPVPPTPPSPPVPPTVVPNVPSTPAAPQAQPALPARPATSFVVPAHGARTVYQRNYCN